METKKRKKVWSVNGRASVPAVAAPTEGLQILGQPISASEKAILGMARIAPS